MTKKPKTSRTAQGKAQSRHEGTEQHGWSPDVDTTSQQENPSAHRSFHADRYAPPKGSGRTVSKEEAGNPHGKPTKSSSRRGEEQSATSAEKGMHDTGPQGRSHRPSGTKDASATTGVDPQDPPGKRSGG